MQNWWIIQQFSKMKEKEILDEAEQGRRLFRENHQCQKRFKERFRTFLKRLEQGVYRRRVLKKCSE